MTEKKKYIFYFSPTFIDPTFDEQRIRSDSMSSRSSRTSSHVTDTMEPTPIHTPENSFM